MKSDGKSNLNTRVIVNSEKQKSGRSSSAWVRKKSEEAMIGLLNFFVWNTVWFPMISGDLVVVSNDFRLDMMIFP